MFDDFETMRQCDEYFSWIDMEIAFGNTDILEEIIPEEYDDWMRSCWAVV